MNRTIIIIESPDSTIEQLERLTKKHGDELILVSNESRHEDRSNLIKVDIRKDFELAKKLIKEKVGKPDAIFTTAEMFMIQTASLAKEFGLLKDALSVIHINRDKEKMKKVWEKSHVLTPYGHFFTSISEVERVKAEFNYPLIVKPSLGYASCGVKKVYSEKELFEQLNKIFLINSTIIAKEKMQNIGCIIEEYIDGEEYSIDTIWCNGEPVCSGILAKGIAEGPYYPDRLYYTDPLLTESKKNKILNLSYDSVKLTGLNNGPTHTEVRFKEDTPYVLETTSRPGAGGIFYEIFKHAYGIDFYEVFYESLFETNLETMKRIAQRGEVLDRDTYYFWYNLTASGSGVIEQIEGVDGLENQPYILKCLPYKKPGNILYKDDLNSDYFFAVLGKYKKNDENLTLKEFTNNLDGELSIVFK